MPAHTDKHYEEELTTLKEEILKMGGLIEEMILKAIRALVDRDTALAAEVILQDREVNRLEMAVDDRCLKLLALHQPAASDLRFIAIGLRITKDLERIGDLAVNIGEAAKDLNAEPPLTINVGLADMASKVQKMVKDALDAFVALDAGQAEGVCKSDDDVDDFNDQIQEKLFDHMAQDVTMIRRSVRLLLIARHLERIADHATNIAEEVIFIVKGQDIRHQGKVE